MGEQFGEKSQEATPHRRQKAREEGQVARSQDLSVAISVLAAFSLMLYFGQGIIEFLAGFTRSQLGEVVNLHPKADFANVVFAKIAFGLGDSFLPLLAMMALAAVLANIGQVGFLFLPQKLMPDFRHINPAKGVSRILSSQGVMRLVFGILKIIVVAAVALLAIWAEMETMLALPGMTVLAISHFLLETIVWTGIKVGFALLIMALLDYAYQKWKHEQDLKMTTQEVREEMKSLQGDPQVLARRRTVQRQLALNRMGNAVPESDVVVTNPTELAIALRYDPETMLAPIVQAKGAGVVAQKIRRLALENDIPIVEKKDLAQFLYKNVEPGEAVPAEHYAAVAEILRYVYDLKGKDLPQINPAA